MVGSFFGPATVVDLLRHRAIHQSEDRAFTYLVDGERDERHLTYSQLDRQAQWVAARLQAAGAAGERVLLLYPPGLEYVAALFGCLYAGAVAVPAYPPRLNRTQERLQAIADDSAARFALTTSGIAGQLRGKSFGESQALASLECLTTDVESPAPPPWQLPSADGRSLHGQSLAILQYTSGSTGDAKGVMLTHANLLHNSALIAHAFEHTRSGLGVFWLPGYHDMGLIGGILQPIFVGRPNVLMSPMAFLQRPVRWLQAISRFGATTSGGPNFAYEHCLRKVADEDLPQLDLSRWRVAFNGAEPVRVDTIDAFTERFARCGFRREAFYPCYGLAEATLLATGGFVQRPLAVHRVDPRALEQHQVVANDSVANNGVGPAADDGRDIVGCGQALPDQRLSIVDPTTLRRAAADQVGEIWLRGPSVARGYWRKPAETTATFGAYLADSGDGPFLRTGDLGFLQGGELFVTGRLKDLIILRGQNHYPQDLERTASQSHPALEGLAAAAFAVEEQDAVSLVVVQEIERGRHAEAAAAIAAMRRELLAEHGLAVQQVVLLRAGRIPRTTSGKVQRAACRDDLLAGKLEIVMRWHAGEQEETHLGALATAARQDSGSTSPTRTQPTATSTQRGENTPATALRLHIAGGDLRESVPSIAVAEIEPLVLREAARIAPGSPTPRTLDTRLTDAGLDSLGRMELLAVLEGRLGIRLPDTLSPQLQTLGDVVAAACRAAQPSATDGVELGSASWSRTSTPQHRDALQFDSHENNAPRFDAPQLDIAQFPEAVALRRDARWLELMGAANPYFRAQEVLPGRRVLVDERELIDFAGYDYLGLSCDARVAAAAKQAIDRYGTSVSGSRLVSGERPVHRELEQRLADWIGTEDALVFVSGHATNVSTIGHLLGPGDLVLHDALAHNSIVQGCRLSGARRVAFPHQDAAALERLLHELRGQYRRTLVAIEGLYSMDGDVPDLPRFVDIKRRYQALLLVDEAHSLGVLGSTGRGVGEHHGVSPADVDLWMGTLSKALASCGGYIAGRRELVEYLKFTSPSFVYSVGISPANAAAALAALNVLRAEPRRVSTLHQRAEMFLTLAREQGLAVGRDAVGPVAPIHVGDAAHCLRQWQLLVEQGILAQPILPPAVPAASARLRFFITAEHSPRQIRQAIEALARATIATASAPHGMAAGA